MIKDNIKAIRQAKRISQAQLAKALNLPQVTICYIETGRRSVKAEELKIIADALGVSVSKLLA